MLLLIEGPAGGGKSELLRELLAAGEIDLAADITELWAAVGGYERDPATGKYPVRRENDPALSAARYLQTVAAGFGLREGYKVAVSTSQRDQVSRWAEVATRHNSGMSVRTVDPGREVVAARLSDPVTGELSADCDAAISRWYR
ncbi:MAG: hypothetical protein OXE42_01295 [Gammaproteobacteria bacterium]|nr:hypothetical protein [Gammaproteobacteria bacterium]